MRPRPQLIMVAGPNGAGKSTYSRSAFEAGFLLLDPDRFGIAPAVNDPMTAGRLTVQRVRVALSRREDFVLETTLSGRFPVRVLSTAARAGYSVTLLYVGVDDPSECIRRVRKRVHEGGHDVPEAAIRRRYVRSLDALPGALRYADRVTIHDNSEGRRYQIIVQKNGPTIAVYPHVPHWAAKAVEALLSTGG